MLTKSIIWDIDGTVIDTRNAMASAYRVACEEMGLKEDNYRRIFAYVGQKSSKVFVDQFGLTGAAYDEAIDRYNRAFLTQGVHDADLYPGMRTLLADLKQAGCQMTVATARSNRSLFPLFEANGLMDTFDHIARPGSRLYLLYENAGRAMRHDRGPYFRYRGWKAKPYHDHRRYLWLCRGKRGALLRC